MIVDLPPEGVALEEVERLAVVQALERCSYSQVKAAALLRITPRTMNYKIKTLGILLPRRRPVQATP